MADNPVEKKVGNDEVDLFDLFRRMGHGIKMFFCMAGRGIIISIVFLLKNWIYLISSLIVGMVLSYVLKLTIKPVYASDMVVACYGAPSDEVIDYVNKLHILSLDNNKPAIAKALSMDENKISQVKDIGAFWVIDKGRDSVPDYIDYNNNHNVYDTVDVKMANRFAVRVKLSSPEGFLDIRDGIFRYIQSNKLFEERNNIRLSQLDELLKRLNYDIIQLDSLQKIKYFEETKNKIAEKGGQLVFLQDQKTQLIFDDIYVLYARKQKFDRQKAIFTGIVTLLSDFTIPTRPLNNTLYYGKIIIPVIFGLCLLILILVHNRKRLNEIFNRYK